MCFLSCFPFWGRVGVIFLTIAENKQMTKKGFRQNRKLHKRKMIFHLLHDAFELLLEEIQSPLDIFNVLSTREDDLS